MLRPIVALLLALPLGAAAQTACTEGRVTNEDTRGHCCWPGQAWSSTRSTCVGIPQCPPGYTVGQSECTAAAPSAAPVATPPPEPPPAPPPLPPASDAPRLSNDSKLMKHMQLSQELADLRRDLEEKHWVSAYVVAGAVGAGLWILGYVLDVALQGIVGGNAGAIAGFWTLFGCGLGGSITFVVMVIVGTVALVQSVVLRNRVNAKAEELRQYDEAEHIPASAPPVSVWEGSRPALTLATF